MILLDHVNQVNFESGVESEIMLLELVREVRNMDREDRQERREGLGSTLCLIWELWREEELAVSWERKERLASHFSVSLTY